MSAIAIAFAILASGPLSWQAAQATREAMLALPCLVEARSSQEARLVVTVSTSHLPVRASAWSSQAFASMDGQYQVRITAVLDQQTLVHDSVHSAVELSITVQLGPVWLRLPAGDPASAVRDGVSALVRSLAPLCQKETGHGRAHIAHADVR